MSLAQTSHGLRYVTLLAIVLAVLAPFAIYAGTALSIVTVWNQSETFAHGYIILPISLWLIWKRRATLATMTPQPGWLGLLLLASAGFAWLLAELGEVQVVRQYAFAMMIPLAAIVVLGWQIAWSMAFPLAFILLAVPFGEIFIDPLMNFTADFTVMALQFTGIPVLREGTNFSIPTGNWSVVEACSGIRYLISSVTLGCLYAYLTYRSSARRIAFIALSIVVPIIANGLRAYMIVMIGHISGMKLAVGVDHLIYGWVFFGLVMFLMFWVGSFWRDDLREISTTNTSEEPLSNTTKSASEKLPPIPEKLLLASLSVLICLAVWPMYASYISHLNQNHEVIHLDELRSDWLVSPSFADWRPSFLPASAEVDRSFSSQDQSHQRVGLLLKYYRNQNKDTTVISTMNVIVSQQEKTWLRTDTNYRSVVVGNQTLTVRENLIKGDTGKLVAWDWYWIDGQFTANKYLGKILQTKGKLLLHGDDAATIIIYAPYSEHPEEARASLQHFLDDNLAAVTTTLAANKK